jgi:hypothetical protein
VFPYPPSNFNPTLHAARAVSAGAVTLSCAVTFNTSTGMATPSTWCGSGQPSSGTEDGGTVILAMTSLTVSNAGLLTVTGDRPLILAVYGDATIDGGVRANASGTTPGPGSSPALCGAGLGGLGGTYQQGFQAGGGGGGGGGFGTGGASGGRGSTKDGPGGPAGMASAANGMAELRPLRGGCPGGQGGAGQSAQTGGVGGAGGGAIQVSSLGRLTLGGVIEAHGGGGQGGPTGTSNTTIGRGGGGGGSGGAVLLEANVVALQLSARVQVNGGGGGSGASSDGEGDDGDDGQTNSSAGGGMGPQYSGPGGTGGFSVVGPTSGFQGIDSQIGGGGGGGGGLGRIRINAAQACTGTAGLTGPHVSKPTPCL